MDKDNIIKNIIKNNYETFQVNREYCMMMREYGTKDKIYNYDADIVNLIGSRKNLSVTELAKIENKTKSSISQIVLKLENKNIIVKVRDPNDHRRKILALTPKGKTIYDFHEKLDKELDNEYYTKIQGYSKSELEIYLKIQNDMFDVAKKMFSQ